MVREALDVGGTVWNLKSKYKVGKSKEQLIAG